MRSSQTLTLPLALPLLIFLAPAQARAQAKEQKPKVFCDPARAAALVREQLSEAKAFDSPARRISVMTRAAELLWPFERQTARDIFTEAYDLAVKDFRQQKDDMPMLSGGVLIQKVDRRFEVMSAIARLDTAWARTLAEGVAEERRRAMEESSGAGDTAGERGRSTVAENTLGLAQSLLPVDRVASLALARGSFRQPASFALILFLFKLAETDQPAADALYREAVAAYAERAAADLAYLAVYPFALSREPASVPVGMYYKAPQGFAPNPQLRELFLETLFRQAERKFRMPEVAPLEDKNATSEQAQLLTMLTMLEPQIARLTPALLERALTLKGLAAASSTEQSRGRAEDFARFAREYEDEGMFDRTAEQVERERDPAKRDFAIAKLVLSASGAAEFARAEGYLGKVSDTDLREKLSSYLYFRWTQQSVAEGQLDDATRLSKKVVELDYRALLSFEIAGAALKELNDRARAVELLEAVAADALKAPDTPEKARALLGVAHLYSEFDATHASQVLRAAVKVINTLPTPDFSGDTIGRQVGNKFFVMYAMYKVPGVRLENVFRELGARDFESALSAAGEIGEKPLRAAAVLGLASRCLEESGKPAKPVKAAPPAKKKQ
ncbi:MAG TPA: hypothetical protein VEX60_08875 [Pyrinomonadaceae bacterium]|nr:hypothetical protein [Pyrinomonadaceae bacterium]